MQEELILEVLQNDHATGAAGIAELVATQPDGQLGIYATSFPQNVVLPAVSFFRTATEPIQYLDGTVDDLTNGKYEVVAWAQTYQAAKHLAEAVRAAMVGATSFRAVWLNQADQFNATPEVYFIIQEFSIWSK